MIMKMRLPVMVAAIAVAFSLSNVPAGSQTIMAPEQAKPKPKATTEAKPKASPGSGGPHVYLLRGLLNVFSLGMDDLAQKLEKRGVRASVYNHAEWQSLSDDIAARYKAGKHGAVILVGHSLGADAVMFMGEYLGKKGVPVALIVPFDGTGSFAATGNVSRVMNLTQRDYAYMKRGNGFRGELQNIDVSKDSSIDHITIDKSARLHNMVVNKILGLVGRGGGAPRATPPSEGSASKPATGASASAGTSGAGTSAQGATAAAAPTAAANPTAAAAPTTAR
jgi:hypothetical protein